MPHRNYKFGDVILPDRMPEDDLSTGMVETSLVDSIGGVYNYFGDTQRFPRRQTITHRGLYVGEKTYWSDESGESVGSGGDYLIWGDTLQMLQAQVDALKAKAGVWDRLYRMRESDGSLQWRMARLLGVNHIQRIEDALVVSRCDCTFELEGGWWQAADVTTQTVSVTAGTPATMVLENAGEAAIEGATITITFTSGTTGTVSLTSVQAGVALAWAGSFSGATLILDTKNQTIYRDGVDAYDGLTLGSGHTVDGWFHLPPGSYAFVVEVTGGNATVSVEHRNLWP